jgi:predicted transcriptional regulator
MGSSKAQYADDEFMQVLRESDGKVRASTVQEQVGCDRSTAWRRLEKLAADPDSPVGREVVIEDHLHRYFYDPQEDDD